MAPKRRKNSEDEEDPSDEEYHLDGSSSDEEIDERPVKRRAPVRKPAKKAAAVGDGPSGSSRAPPRGKKGAAAKEDTSELRVDSMGRTVKYRPTASQDVKARIARAMPGSAHRMFLVDTKPLAPPGAEGGPVQEFNVLGATGNVYAVRICRHPHCTCPDFAKGHLCKHILFVMLRVLRRSPEDPIIWQPALLTREVQQVLSSMTAGAGPAAGVDLSVLASERVRQRYAAIAGAAAGAAGGNGVQRPVEGECPICYEDMVAAGAPGGRAEAVVFCHTCGNNMHKECFDRWAASKRAGGNQVTCVYCRSPWQMAGGSAGPSAGEYVNLAQYSDAHRQGASLQDLYGSNAYFIMANAGDMSRRQAARMHAASQGWV